MSDQGESTLHKPLGQMPSPARRLAMPGWVAKAVLGVLSAVFIAAGGWIALVDDPMGGEPTAVATIKPREEAPSTSAQAQPPGQAGIRSLGDDGRTVSSAREMEASAGVTVVRPGAEAPNSVIIRIGEPDGPRLAAAPDPRLVERSRHGSLPRMSVDGARPFDVYARPIGQLPAKVAGRIAILVGGMGISQNATADAITRLPGQVSFAFAPYGSELERSVSRARADGHEVFLQVPMEPFDYPDNDPGPHTLLTSLKPAENLERLHWTMARFPGYVGIVNFTGGRFTAEEAALSPIVKEIVQRGLMVVDDGSSARSLMTSGLDRRYPSLKADLVLDGTARGDAIDKQLARLEELAKERGTASATASVLPLTIDRIARWSRSLEAKGLVLVPMSSLGGVARQPATTGSIR